MRRSRRAAALAATVLLAAPAAVGQGEPPRGLNPFDDPFLQATAGRPCPAPLGPAYSEAERRVEAHSRVERGTTCWLQGLCAEPNAYRYDAANAIAAAAALRRDPALAGTTMWL